jgi:hypothetical protein
MKYLVFFLLLQIDPGYCGAFGVETGPLDPFWKSGACPRHDEKMTEQKNYEQSESIWTTQSTFAGDMVTTAGKEVVEGVWALLMVGPMTLIGVLVGMGLQKKREYKKTTSGGHSGQYFGDEYDE